MSLRHFKRLNCATATNSTKTSDKEVRRITTCSNTDNDILNNMKTSETAVKNCSYNNFVPDNPVPDNPHDQINLPQEIGFELDTITDTLGSNNNYTTCNKLSIKDKLQQWVLAFNISKNSVNNLLNILRSEGLDLPKDVRTLMNTPRSHNVININPGTYIHLGLKKMLSTILNFNKHCLRNINQIYLSINIDGLPLAHSSKQQFWPILCSITNVPQLSKLVFAVGLYFSTDKKPESIEDFLNLFLNEAIELVNNGISFDNKVISIHLKQVICDSPAKAFLLNVRGHNARFGCNTCTVEGEYKEHRMTFFEVNAPLRTDTSFRAKSDDEYHKGYCPLERLPIDMIKAVPIDYMHAVCLGAMKRLLKFWVRGKQSTKIPSAKCDAVNIELNSLKDYFPSEFVRLPRSLNDIEYWKANEFRTFLLFTGPVVLKGRLKKQLYLNFIKLHGAIKMLVTPGLCLIKNDIAYNLLIDFVKEFRIIYGAHFVTHNIHSLIHLPFYAKIHGCLDNFSAYKFENYLGLIKKSISHSRFPLQEATNRILEKVNNMYTGHENTNFNKTYKLGKECELDNNIFYKDLDCTFYQTITLTNTNYLISTQQVPKNNYIMLTTNEIASVKHISKCKNEDIFFNVFIFKSFNFFYVPFESSVIGSVIVDIKSQSDLMRISVNGIKYKCFYVPLTTEKAVVRTLSHNEII